MDIGTPRSRTLAALSVARASMMDTFTIKKWHMTMLVFFMSWFIFFSIFMCFYPTALLGDPDVLESFGVPAGENTDQINQDDQVLSDRGRQTIWISSLGFGAVVAFIYHFFYIQFFH